MFIKYIPCQDSNRETQIRYISENTINIDGEDYTFPIDYVVFPNVVQDTFGAIIEAYYKESKLYLTIVRRYIKDHSWYSDQFLEITEWI